MYTCTVCTLTSFVCVWWTLSTCWVYDLFPSKCLHLILFLGTKRGSELNISSLSSLKIPPKFWLGGTGHSWKMGWMISEMDFLHLCPKAAWYRSHLHASCISDLVYIPVQVRVCAYVVTVMEFIWIVSSASPKLCIASFNFTDQIWLTTYVLCSLMCTLLVCLSVRPYLWYSLPSCQDNFESYHLWPVLVHHNILDSTFIQTLYLSRLCHFSSVLRGTKVWRPTSMEAVMIWRISNSRQQDADSINMKFATQESHHSSSRGEIT